MKIDDKKLKIVAIYLKIFDKIATESIDLICSL